MFVISITFLIIIIIIFVIIIIILIIIIIILEVGHHLSNVPPFLDFNVFRIINVWPEIPTSTDFFECPVFVQIQRFSG